MSGAISMLSNLTPSRVPSNVVDLALTAMSTASSKRNFADVFENLKGLSKQTTFNIDQVEDKDLDVVESIFANAVRIYDSEVLLDRWAGKDNKASAFKAHPNLRFWKFQKNHYK